MKVLKYKTGRWVTNEEITTRTVAKGGTGGDAIAPDDRESRKMGR